MSADRSADGPSLSKAMETLRDAMRGRGGNTTDPDRRRAAATLGELLRSEEDELERFATRHLPGGAVDPATVKALQELVLDVARLVTLHGGQGGRQADARALSASVRATLLAGLEALERDPPRTAPPVLAGGVVAGPLATPPPPAVPAPLPAAPPRQYATPSYALAPGPGGRAPSGGYAVVHDAPPGDVAAAPPVVPPPPPTPGPGPSPPRVSVTLPDVLDEETRMDGTVCDDDPVVAPAMPFQPAPASVRSPAPTGQPRATRPGAHLAGTAPPFSRVDADAVLPFQATRSPAPAPAPAIPMPIELYAAFLAELSRDYARAPAIRARYGIADEAAQRDLGAAFASAFERNPALRATFDGLLRRMRQGG